MRLDLDRTPSGTSTLPLAGELKLAFGPGGPDAVAITGELQVDNMTGRVLIRGEVTATGQVDCDRCLGGFRLAFPIPVDILVFRDNAEEGEEDGLVLHQRGGELDLHGPLTEAAVLAVPQQRVCRPDCQGLCPHCGQDLNRGSCSCADDDNDPRWDGLPE